MSTRQKATHSGLLFGQLDCYVLEDERRMVSGRGMVRALSGGSSSAPLGQYLSRIPSGDALLSAHTVLEFITPNGSVAKGIDATLIPDLLQLYIQAWDAGTLHSQQIPVAVRAAKMLGALAKVGVIALIDEATGYQLQREAAALSFAYRAIIADSTCPWNLMWPSDFAESMCRLHDEPFDGTQPKFLASTYEKLYRLVLGDDVYVELKRRNPEPSFGTNHHQWLTPEAREVVRRQIPILTALAETCGAKDEFWARVEHRYANRPLQLSFLVPRRPPKNDPEAAE